MSEIKLLPCPFCGGEAELYTESTPFTIGCRCSSCFARTSRYTPNLRDAGALKDIQKCTELAISAWNTRKPMREIVERLEAHRDDFLDDVYAELDSDPDNCRANRIIEKYDEERPDDCCCGCEKQEEIEKKLCIYEDAEEQGLLVRLPCKIGDTV